MAIAHIENITIPMTGKIPCKLDPQYTNISNSTYPDQITTDNGNGIKYL